MSCELRTYTLAVVVEPAEDAWHACWPTLLDDGAATWGSTREEAREHLREMVAMVVERLTEKNVPVLAVPADPAPMPLEQMVVTVDVPIA
jgi:predicted RNase H-like HicB family nuclease